MIFALDMKLTPFLSLWIVITAFILLSRTSFSQGMIYNPPRIAVNATSLPAGSGARALGYGGAFIAVADDATAASWNPGGLAQLERPELSVAVSFLSAHHDFEAVHTELLEISSRDETISRGDLNFASVVYPFSVFGKNVVAALNYQQIYDFHSALNYRELVEEGQLSIERKAYFESEGGIGALTPALAVRVIPKLCVGVAVNFYTDEFFGNYAWRQIIKAIDNGSFGFNRYNVESDSSETFKNFHAVNVTTGLLWDVWAKEDRRLAFGAVYDTPYTADVDRVTDSSFTGTFEGDSHERSRFEIDYPMSFGAGLGFRYSDALLLSMDVTWTDWSAYVQKDEDGERRRPLGDAPASTEVDDTYAVRLGAEYLIFWQKVIVPVRGGLFSEPRPSLDNPTDVYGFSVGSGITFERFSIDGAYQFRWTNNVDGEDFGLDGTHFDLTEHLFLASVIVYF